jgi:hypothetical protein
VSVEARRAARPRPDASRRLATRIAPRTDQEADASHDGLLSCSWSREPTSHARSGRRALKECSCIHGAKPARAFSPSEGSRPDKKPRARRRIKRNKLHSFHALGPLSRSAG